MRSLLLAALLLGLVVVVLTGTGCQEVKVPFTKVATNPADKNK